MLRERRSGVVDVAVREVIWIWRDQVALLVVVGIPLIAFAILAATFSNAVIRDLRVSVVDQDRSETSQPLSRRSARPRRQRCGAVFGSQWCNARDSFGRGPRCCLHPVRILSRDLLAGRRPQVVIFFNKQFFTPGNVASGSLQAAVSAAVAALPVGPACDVHPGAACR